METPNERPKGSAGDPSWRCGDRPLYPLNCWWVAATSAEVGSQPLARRLLDRNVVLFRTAGGVVTALEDRCPHRGAPLSRGRVFGEEIICPYHGFRYGTGGRCTHIPTQDHIPPALSVTAYPICEFGPYVWIWMGEPSAADEARLPRLDWPTDPAAMRLSRYSIVHCDYAALHTNFMDLAHVMFLHDMEKDWLEYGIAPRSLMGDTTLEQTPDALVRTTRRHGSDPLALDVRALGMDPSHKIDCFHRVKFLPPGCFYQEEMSACISVPLEQRRPYGFRGVYCTTPISAGRCHWWWLYAFDFGHELAHEYQARWDTVLKEDTDLLEAMQKARDQDPQSESEEVLVLADQAPTRVRRMIQDLIEAETVK